MALSECGVSGQRCVTGWQRHAGAYGGVAKNFEILVDVLSKFKAVQKTAEARAAAAAVPHPSHPNARPTWRGSVGGGWGGGKAPAACMQLSSSPM